jgi:hypothetical protein
VRFVRASWEGLWNEGAQITRISRYVFIVSCKILTPLASKISYGGFLDLDLMLGLGRKEDGMERIKSVWRFFLRVWVGFGSVLGWLSWHDFVMTLDHVVIIYFVV